MLGRLSHYPHGLVYGYRLQTNGTDNHLVLWDLRPAGVTGSKVEKICDLVGITINKNAVSGDSKLPPSRIHQFYF